MSLCLISMKMNLRANTFSLCMVSREGLFLTQKQKATRKCAHSNPFFFILLINCLLPSLVLLRRSDSDPSLYSLHSLMLPRYIPSDFLLGLITVFPAMVQQKRL